MRVQKRKTKKNAAAWCSMLVAWPMPNQRISLPTFIMLVEGMNACVHRKINDNDRFFWRIKLAIRSFVPKPRGLENGCTIFKNIQIKSNAIFYKNTICKHRKTLCRAFDASNTPPSAAAGHRISHNTDNDNKKNERDTHKPKCEMKNCAEPSSSPSTVFGLFAIRIRINIILSNSNYHIIVIIIIICYYYAWRV